MSLIRRPARSFALMSAAALTLAAPAHAAQKRFGVVSFSQIQVEGNFNGDIRVGSSASVIAEGEAAALERLSVEVVNDTLVIREVRDEKERGASDRKRTPITLNIAATRLNAVMLNGNGKLTATGLREESATFVLRGSGALVADAISATAVNAGIDGAGSLTLRGKAQVMKIRLKGSGSVDGRGLSVRELDVDAKGSASGTFTATRRAGVVAEGLTTITVTGTTACAVKNSGNGEVYCGR